MSGAKQRRENDVILDCLCLLNLVFGTGGGVYLLNPGIDITEASKSVAALAFYGGPVAGALLIAGCYTLGRIRYETSWSLLIPFFGLAILTLPVSIDPFVTATTLVRNILLLASINAYVQVRGGKSFFRIATIFLVVTNIYSLYEALFRPGVGIHNASNSADPGIYGNWRGIFFHKNILGQASVTTLIPLLFFPRLLPWSRPLSYLAAAICAANLIGSHSATSEVTLVACIPFYFLFLRRRRSSRAVIAGFALSIVGGAALSLALPLVLDLFGRDLTFSHRSDIWDLTLSTIADRPWFGYGYGAGSTYLTDILTSHLFRAAVDAHNAYLQTAIEVGFVGLFAMLFALLSSIPRVLIGWSAEPSEIATSNRAFALIIMGAMVSAFTEISPGVTHSTTGFMTFGSILAISRIPRAPRRRAAAASVYDRAPAATA